MIVEVKEKKKKRKKKVIMTWKRELEDSFTLKASLEVTCVEVHISFYCLRSTEFLHKAGVEFTKSIDKFISFLGQNSGPPEEKKRKRKRKKGKNGGD